VEVDHDAASSLSALEAAQASVESQLDFTNRFHRLRIAAIGERAFGSARRSSGAHEATDGARGLGAHGIHVRLGEEGDMATSFVETTTG